MKFILWAIGSTQFKKWNGILGGIAFGMWLNSSYWHQINGMLAVWGLTTDDYRQALMVIVGATGITLSVWLSAAKKRQESSK